MSKRFFGKKEILIPGTGDSYTEPVIVPEDTASNNPEEVNDKCTIENTIIPEIASDNNEDSAKSNPEENKVESITTDIYRVEVQIKRLGKNESLQVINVEAVSPDDAGINAINKISQGMKEGWDCELTGRISKEDK